MKLPIYAYGHPVLKKVGANIDAEYPELAALMENMWETMYHAQGVGLAAPQIGLPIRMFMVDTLQLKDEEKQKNGIKKVFINAQILEESGEINSMEEGCLSIPDIRGEVERLSIVKIRYQDENFNQFEETYEGFNARVIQHEYDHIEGKLFIEKLKPIRKRMIQRKLEAIRLGRVDSDYKMKFGMVK